MGEAHVLDVVDQLAGELDIAQAHSPGTDVHFVDCDRRGMQRGLPALFDPGVVGPLVMVLVYLARGRGRHLGRVGQRVGLLPPYPVRTENLVFVLCVGGHAGDEQLPHARRAERAHRVPPPVPEVEVPDDADAPGVRRPHREGDALDPGAVVMDVRAEHLPQLFVPAFPNEVEVHLADRGQVPVGVVGDERAVAGVGGLDAVVVDAGALDDPAEHAAFVQPGQLQPGVADQRGDGFGGGPQRADDRPAVRRVLPEDAVRVVMGAVHQAVEFGFGHLGGRRAGLRRFRPARLGLAPGRARLRRRGRVGRRGGRRVVAAGPVPVAERVCASATLGSGSSWFGVRVGILTCFP